MIKIPDDRASGVHARLMSVSLKTAGEVHVILIFAYFMLYVSFSNHFHFALFGHIFSGVSIDCEDCGGRRRERLPIVRRALGVIIVFDKLSSQECCQRLAH